MIYFVCFSRSQPNAQQGQTEFFSTRKVKYGHKQHDLRRTHTSHVAELDRLIDSTQFAGGVNTV